MSIIVRKGILEGLKEKLEAYKGGEGDPGFKKTIILNVGF